MPALASRIGFITQPQRVVTAGPDAAVETLYGNAARDTPEPIATFFDSVTDAQAMADERLVLLKAQRSLVSVSIDQVETAAGLDISLGLPTARVIDDEQERNNLALVVGFTIDMNTERSALPTWG
jgi:hypothetical protein